MQMYFVFLGACSIMAPVCVFGFDELGPMVPRAKPDLRGYLGHCSRFTGGGVALGLPLVRILVELAFSSARATDALKCRKSFFRGARH